MIFFASLMIISNFFFCNNFFNTFPNFSIIRKLDSSSLRCYIKKLIFLRSFKAKQNSFLSGGYQCPVVAKSKSMRFIRRILYKIITPELNFMDFQLYTTKLQKVIRYRLFYKLRAYFKRETPMVQFLVLSWLFC